MLAQVLALCPSVTSRSSIETAEQIELVLVWELPSIHPNSVKRKFGYSEIRVLPSGTLLQTLDFENFATV